MSASMVGIPRDAVPDVWPQIANWVDTACLRVNGRYLPEDAYNWLMGREWQLWLAVADGVIIACCCTSIVNYPRKKYCRVELAGGHSLARWRHCMADIERWARWMGCDGLELGGRAGWKKIFKDWKLINIFIEKDI